jgi:hypothetical protein
MFDNIANAMQRWLERVERAEYVRQYRECDAALASMLEFDSLERVERGASF